jgi:hypothetical protein
VSGLKSFRTFRREWIVDDGNDCDLAQRRVHGLPGFDRNVINERKRAAICMRSPPRHFFVVAQ